ncbi:MAG: DUF805 domain-containing protein [Pseudomonadota bacterium]
MGLKEAVRTGLRKWITFSGRASRAEYWWFYLGSTLIMLAVIAVAALLVMGLSNAPQVLFWPIGIVVGLVLLWLYIAQLSAFVRRFHDRNLSGWWILGYIGLSAMGGALGELAPGIGLIASILMFAAAIAVFVITVLRGTEGANAFGPDPLVEQRPEQVFE